MERVGYYCWAGPGTIRMTNLKFFKPKINIQSLMASYEYDYISKVKDKFGVTDFWATYSWGFNEKTEIEDKAFLIDRINNFKKAGVKLHAYIQGPNVVYKDFLEKDWYCKDQKGRLVTYYRGRKVVCINNPEFVEYKLSQIEEMLGYDFGGIFMDNIQMGQLGIPFDNITPTFFAGCTCKYCQKLYKDKFQAQIPTNFTKNYEETLQYLDFRKACMSNFLEKVSQLIHQKKKNIEFGTNTFDPKLDLGYTNGIDINQLDKIQDYFLFENHSLPSKFKNNHYIANIAQNLRKPVFVVSYKNGIGHDSRYSQWDINRILTEDKFEPFYSCIKGSEYITNGVWHNLNIDSYNKPNIYKKSPHLSETLGSKKFEVFAKSWLLKSLVSYFFNPFYTLYMENQLIRNILHKIFYSFVV